MSGRRQRPRFVCQGCGRTSAWRPGAVCSRCQRDAKRDDERRVHELVLEQERRRLRPTLEERAEDLARFGAIHERWLAKQAPDHPWRTPPAGEQLTLDDSVRVERERGAA